ncbi:MAG: bacterial transcriptional activator domain-containing protein, partial [Ilumatobacteraceae bacterium]
QAAAILRHIAASRAVSPFLEAARVFTVGLGEVGLGSPNSEGVDSFDAAVDAALMSAGSTANLAHGATTFEMRAGAVGGEAWEPAVVVAVSDEAPPFEQSIARALAGGRGLAVVADVPLEGDWQLTAADGCHVLEPLGLQLQPVGLDEADLAAVQELLAEPFVVADTMASVTPLLPSMAEVEPFVERPWALRVGVFGGVEVVSREGVVAQCERSKAVELIAWLGQHRERPTRTAARTALWDVEVRDATFANVVSDARRATARAVAPPEGEEWISRTLTDELPLHRLVATDAELLAHRLAGAQGRPPLDAIEVLRPGVALLGGMPFAGTGYLWPDAEGATSSLVLLATSAAIELANHYLALGDVEGVFWASGQGLKVLSGHEELIALRMRAHARRGDLAGVRSEWESYERAIAADPWADSEPAPKLVALRRELLSTTTKPDAEGA